MKIFAWVFIFLLAITIVNAYNQNNIVAYYSFQNWTSISPGIYNIPDDANNYDIYADANDLAIASSAGLIGNGLSKYLDTYNSALYTYGKNYSNMSTDFSIVVFAKRLSIPAYYTRIYLYNGQSTALGSMYSYNSQTHLNSLQYRNSSGNSTGISGAFTWATTEWSMIAMTYDRDTNSLNASVFTPSGILSNINVTMADWDDIPLALNNFRLFLLGKSYIDEMSIWNETLSYEDIYFLWNNGNGLSLNDIRYYENYSIGYGTIRYLYDICLPFYTNTTLCTYAVLNYSINNLYCYNESYITVCDASCTDTQAYYNSVGGFPPLNNYNGSCTNCSNTCDVVGEKRCYNDYISQFCFQTNDGCKGWTLLAVCPTGQVCSNGLCTYGGNETSLTGDATDDFLAGQGISPGLKYLIVLMLLFITIGAFVTIGYQMDMAKGGFIVGLILACFEVIIAVVLGWIPAWILVAMILFSIAGIYFTSRTSSGM